MFKESIIEIKYEGAGELKKKSTPNKLFIKEVNRKHIREK